MSESCNMAVLPRLRQAAREKVALDSNLAKMLLAGGAGAVTAGVPIALVMKAHEEAARKRARNIGFGAGAAAGLAAPHVVQGLGDVLQKVTP